MGCHFSGNPILIIAYFHTFISLKSFKILFSSDKFQYRHCFGGNVFVNSKRQINKKCVHNTFSKWCSKKINQLFLCSWICMLWFIFEMNIMHIHVCPTPAVMFYTEHKVNYGLCSWICMLWLFLNEHHAYSWEMTLLCTPNYPHFNLLTNYPIEYYSRL